MRSEATCLHTGGHLLGVFDGHAGGACAQIVAKRLLRYIGSGLVPVDQLRQLLADGARSDSFLQCHNDQVTICAYEGHTPLDNTVNFHVRSTS